MPGTQFTCPSCDTTLKLSQTLAPGKRIKCPRCAKVVTVPEEEDEEEREPAPGTRRPAPRRKHEAFDEEDEWDEPDEEPDERPRKFRKKPKQKKKSNAVLLWSLVGGGVGLVLIAGVIILFATGVIGPKRGKELAAQIVGTWESQGAVRETLEFESDGTLHASIPSILTTVKGTYRVLSDDEVEITVTQRGQTQTKRYTVTMQGDEMTMTDRAGRVERYKRVKATLGRL